MSCEHTWIDMHTFQILILSIDWANATKLSMQRLTINKNDWEINFINIYTELVPFLFPLKHDVIWKAYKNINFSNNFKK